MDEGAERTAGAALRRALEEETVGVEARTDLVDGALRRGRSRLRRRRAAGGAAAALALVAGVGLVVQLPGTGATSASSEAAGAAGDSAAPSMSASSPSAAAGAEDGAAAELGPQQDSTDQSAGDFVVLSAVDGSAVVLRDAAVFADRAGADAVVAGELAVVGGTCLGLRGEDGSEVVVVWPSGTTVLDDAVGVDVPDLGAYALGDPFEGRGGYGGQVDVGLLAGCPPVPTAYLNEEQR